MSIFDILSNVVARLFAPFTIVIVSNDYVPVAVMEVFELNEKARHLTFVCVTTDTDPQRAREVAIVFALVLPRRALRYSNSVVDCSD